MEWAGPFQWPGTKPKSHLEETETEGIALDSGKNEWKRQLHWLSRGIGANTKLSKGE